MKRLLVLGAILVCAGGAQAHPERMFEKLGLSDEQKAEVQAVFQNRPDCRSLEDELEKSDCRAEAMYEMRTRLRSILTDEQFLEFQKMKKSKMARR